MKTMKKLVAALLVLTMVLALTGSAFAACSLEKGDWVIFKSNTNAFKNATTKKAEKVRVNKGSWAQIVCVKGDRVKLELSSDPETYSWQYWFNTKAVKFLAEADELSAACVWYADGGSGKSRPVADSVWDVEIEGCYKYIKIDGGKTNVRKGWALNQKTIGTAKNGQKLEFLGKAALDDRGIVWLKVKFNGKCGWVSLVYVKQCANGDIKFYKK